MNPTTYSVEKVRGDTLEYDVTLWNFAYSLAACTIWVTLKQDLGDPDASGIQATTANGGITILFDGLLTTASLSAQGAGGIALAAPLPINLPDGTILGFAAGLAVLKGDHGAGTSSLSVQPLASAIPAGDQARVGKVRATFAPAVTQGFTADVTLTGDVQLKYPTGHVHTAARISSKVYRDATVSTA